jgi:glycosyltransferase involved in cell wall biosynthesis
MYLVNLLRSPAAPRLSSTMPKVSVIIPTHNRAHFLRGAIFSILNQTFQDVEIIVVDDASTDNTSEVVAAFNDERIRFLRHDTNKGGSAARNTGILASTCDYIAFLDDDDEWLPDKLRKQMEILRASPPEVGVVYTGCVDVNRTTGKVNGQQIPTKRGNLSKKLLVANCVGGASSVLLKRKCLQKVGLFDESLPCSQDYDLWIRISNEFLFECVPEPLFKYHIHENKISTNLEALTRGMEIMATKYRDYPLSYYREQYIDVGIMYCLAGELQKGRKAFFKAIKLYPIQVRAYFNFCLSLLGADKFRKIKKAERKAFACLAPIKRA